MNKNILNEKYKSLISYDKVMFVKDLNFIRANIKFESLGKEPLLIFSRNKRDALSYALCVYNALKQERLLDYKVITARSIADQSFMSEERRDAELQSAIYYADILFITMNNYDYTTEFIDVLTMDLIEFRKNAHRITVVLYDTTESIKAIGAPIQRVLTYFKVNNFRIIDLLQNSDYSSDFDIPTPKSPAKDSPTGNKQVYAVKSKRNDKWWKTTW